MSYDLHITRRGQWTDEGSDISLDEWLAYVDAAPDLRLDGHPDIARNGISFSLARLGTAVWLGWSESGVEGGCAWFGYLDGIVNTKNPDTETRRRMLIMAQHFGARVQGDDGETYGEFGEVLAPG